MINSVLGNSVENNTYFFKNYRDTIKYLQNNIYPLIHKDSVVLDAGCGTGNPLISKHIVKELIGCDINLDAIKSNVDISYGLVGDLENIVFCENTFDLIMSFDVIEHIENPLVFIKNAYKSLRKGGYLFLVMPNRNSLFGLVARLFPYSLKVKILKILGSSTTNTVHYYRLNTPSSIIKALISDGFNEIRIVMLNRLPMNPGLRMVLFFYCQLCKIKVFHKFSVSILLIAKK